MDFLPQLRSYFAAEKNATLLFMLLGGAMLMTAFFCWFVWKKPFYLGMAWPLAVIALLQLAVGASVYFRTDGQVKALEAQFERSPAELAATELPRMEKVMRSFPVLLGLAGLLLAVSFGLILWHSKADFWKGFGAALFMQSGLVFCTDFFAQKRGQAYLDTIKLIDGL